jgi:hypothetical protein
VAEPDYRGRAAAGIAALQRWYRPRTGLWAGTGWWNSASALTAVIRYTQLTGDGSHAGVIATTFTAAQRQHARFVNTYYDDNAWWALAPQIAAFDLTRNSRYLEAARDVFARNRRLGRSAAAAYAGTRRHLQERDHQRAVLHLAALRTSARPEGGYLTWAQRGWEWFSARGFIGPTAWSTTGSPWPAGTTARPPGPTTRA